MLWGPQLTLDSTVLLPRPGYQRPQQAHSGLSRRGAVEIYAQGLAINEVQSHQGNTYPHPFHNDEQLDLTTQEPRLEFLVRSSRFKGQGDAGAVRVIYTRGSTDGGHYDVIYHDRKKSRDVEDNGVVETVWGPFRAAVRISLPK
jgi:hypothetical protein